jgi:hypothetical protein
VIGAVLVGVGLGNGVRRDSPARGRPAPATPTVGSIPSISADQQDILLTEEPWQGAVSAHLGQRLVVVLTNNGLGGWTALKIDGSAIGRLGGSGSYDYRCQQSPAFAEFAVLQAQQLGTALLTSYGDAGCFHVQPACTMPQKQWTRTVTVTSVLRLRFVF